MRQQFAILLSLFLILLATACKKDDNNDWNPPPTGDYFTCLVNGERLETSSSFNCSGKTFYYYPPGIAGMDSSYLLVSGQNCNGNGPPVVSLRFIGIEPFTGYLDFLSPEPVDSCTPVIIGSGLIAYDQLLQGWINVEEFSPRQPNNGEFGTFKGTFEFTVTHDTIETVYEVTEGEFRFAVPNIW
jgi:hypothetical protein